jgi:L-alanine-DL-glutamate epimerase-like enolase superfamily enzyme
MKGKLPLKISEHVDAFAASGELEVWTREKLLDAWISGGARLGVYVEQLAGRAPVPIWIEHSIDNGIAQVFQAHQAAAFPAIEYAISITHVLADDCMQEPFAMRDGYYTIPAGPGLGVSLDMGAIDRYRVA